MKRIIGAGLAVLLVFAAIGTLRPHEAEALVSDCSDHDSLGVYNAIFCYYDGAITQPELQNILSRLTPPVVVVSIEPSTVTIETPAGSRSPLTDSQPPRDLTPWAMIKGFIAQANPGSFCATTFTVNSAQAAAAGIPAAYRPGAPGIPTDAGGTYTVKNLNYNGRYCSAIRQWERTKDFYMDHERPPRPRIEDY